MITLFIFVWRTDNFLMRYRSSCRYRHGSGPGPSELILSLYMSQDQDFVNLKLQRLITDSVKPNPKSNRHKGGRSSGSPVPPEGRLVTMVVMVDGQLERTTIFSFFSKIINDEFRHALRGWWCRPLNSFCHQLPLEGINKINIISFNDKHKN